MRVRTTTTALPVSWADVAVPVAVVLLCWLPLLVGFAVWVGGQGATLLVTGRWPSLDPGWTFLRVLLRRGPAGVWPSTPSALLWSCIAAVVVVPAGAIAGLVYRVRIGGRRPTSSADILSLSGQRAARRARELRPGLNPRNDLEPGDVGIALGQDGSRQLFASWEDVVLAVMAPRAGKTTSLAVPAILDAPGAVIATSNKADLWLATSLIRAAESGEPVWVFDPQQIVHAPRTWWWNPLRGVVDVEEAHRLAEHFVQELRGSRRASSDFWTSAAQDLLTGLLLAAGCTGRTLIDVYEWLNDPVLATPVELLRAVGHRAAADSLLGRMHGAPETRDGIYETARTAAQCLRNDAILAWVTPPSVRDLPPIAELDAASIAVSQQTVYLLSKDGAGNAAPLVSALTDRIMREATRAAERAGGRLDPPLVVVLDEAANICRIADLPDLYSHLGSRGIVPLTILQSYKQGVRVWGEHGMDTLWSASTIKLIGPGLDDARLAEDLSRLIGEHDVPVVSRSYGDRRATTSVNPRRQRILGPEDIRALPRGTALLLATGCRTALIDLLPWFRAPRASRIQAAIDSATHQLTTRARAGNWP